jgi:hypothetical protein
VQLGLKEKRVRKVQLQPVIRGRQIALLCHLPVDEGEGAEYGGGEGLAGLAATGERVLEGEFLVDALLARLAELPEILTLLLMLALLLHGLPLSLLHVFALVDLVPLPVTLLRRLFLLRPLRPALHLRDLRMQLLEKELRFQGIIGGHGRSAQGRLVLIEQKVVLLALAAIDDILLQLLLPQTQLLVVEAVILLLTLVASQDRLELGSVRGSGRQNDLALLPRLPPVDVALEDAVDQPSHFCRICQV